MEKTKEEIEARGALTGILCFIVVVVLAIVALNVYSDSQPFKITLKYRQSSGNNQVNLWSNKAIKSTTAWIERDGKKIYEAGMGGYDQNKIVIDGSGHSFTVYVPYADEFPTPGRYEVKVRFVTNFDKEYIRVLEVKKSPSRTS